MFVCLYVPIWKATVSTLCVFSLRQLSAGKPRCLGGGTEDP